MDELLRNLAHLMKHRTQIDRTAFAELMGQILDSWPGVAWEFGPDPSAPHIDRLSLSVDEGAKVSSKRMIAAQLPLIGDGWTIALGIPPRDWEMYFEATLNGHELGIEGATWRWRMADAGSQIALILAAPDQLNSLTDNDLGELAGIIVNGELGESNCLTHVKSIATRSMKQDAQQWHPMDQLRNTFVEKFPGCEYGAWLAASRQSDASD